MKIAFIHNTKKIYTGAHFINELIVNKLQKKGVKISNFYPKFFLKDVPINFKGINNILYFFSLLEKRKEVLHHDVIQGTTYTPLAFLSFSKPIISHFGSTTMGFLKAVPRTSCLERKCANKIIHLRDVGVISELNIKTRRPLNDIASIEQYAALHVDYIIATSSIVKKDLLELGIPSKKIIVIHNAIEDYWFNLPIGQPLLINNPHVVFIGRVINDPFNLKLKGIDRLIYIFEQLASINKVSIIKSCKNNKLTKWMQSNFLNHTLILNMARENIPMFLNRYAGSIVLMPSRYEGFSLSLVEAMSQGLVPVTFPVGVAPEIIINGENGFIVHTVDEALNKISLLLKNQRLRWALSLEARKTIEKFKSDDMANNVINLYKKVLSF